MLERESTATIPSIESLKPLRTYTLLFVAGPFTRAPPDRPLLLLEEVQRLTVGPDELVDPHRMRVVLANISACRDGVSGLQRVLVPASPGQLVRSSQFGLPLFDFALVVLHVKMELHVRINKKEFRHRCLYSDDVFGIVRSRPVVRERRTRNGQNSDNTNYQKQVLCFHWATIGGDSLTAF